MVVVAATPTAGHRGLLACSLPNNKTISYGCCIGRSSLLKAHHRNKNKNALVWSNRSLTTMDTTPILVTPVKAIATEEGQLVSAESDLKKKTKYHFVVANAKFMLDEEEHFQELMAERLRNFGERNKEVDFWLVIEPKFLDKFPNITKRLRRPAVALVSTNATWIKFMKLRLDRVLEGEFEAETSEEAFASTPVELQFEKPENWTAPYPKYEYGWWKCFLPPQME